MNILLYLEYDGTAFHGYQRQSSVRTVQGELEAALYSLLGEEVTIHGSSRTDAGVHALAYPVSFQTASTIPPAKFALALNPHLPEDLKVLESMAVPEAFHARASSRGKTYVYRILQRLQPSPLHRNQAYLVRRPLDIPAMEAAAERFLGTHDFSAFKSVGSTDPNPVKDMQGITITQEGDLVDIRITASGFLYNMARIMAGTLVDAGHHRITPEEITTLLKTGKRGKAMVLPPQGLYLEKVYYAPEDLSLD